MSTLYIVRGLPGSGKTTFAKKHFDCLHLEADMFFVHNRSYDWKPGGENHKWCMSTCRDALSRGMDVVVSNTFTTKKEIAPYCDMASEVGAGVRVFAMCNKFDNVHYVPAETLRRMSDRWEAWEGETKVEGDFDPFNVILATDGRVSDADGNAAINICNHHHPASFDLPLDGRLDLVGRPPSTGRSSDGLTPVGQADALRGRRQLTPNMLLDAMRMSNSVVKKSLSDGIVSYNYSRKAFYKDKWNDATINARGLFMRGDDVVARSFRKFFRVGECPLSTPEAIFRSIDFDVDTIDIHEKFNGYLGIVAYDPEKHEWRAFSRTSTDNPYSENLKRILKENGFWSSMEEAALADDGNRNYSFVFEVVDNERDPHFVDDTVPNGRAYLIGAFENWLGGADIAMRDMVASFGGWVNLCMPMSWADVFRLGTKRNEEDFRRTLADMTAWLSESARPAALEGFVISIRHGRSGTVDRYKVKNATYCFWKHVRRFVDSPRMETRDDGRLRVDKYRGRPEELVKAEPWMDDAVDRLNEMTRDDLVKFKMTDLGGRSRIDMIRLSKHIAGQLGWNQVT